MIQQIDAHLAVDEVDGEHRIVCRHCSEDICAPDENYKLHALCERDPIQEAGPLVNDPNEYVDADLEFRKFYCPGCATLLETELIEADLEPTHDKQLFLD